MSENDPQGGSAGPNQGPNPDAEPTQQFTQAVPTPPSAPPAGPTVPPPAAGVFGEPTTQFTYPVPAPTAAPATAPRRRRGLAAAAVAATVLIGVGAGYGGAALYDHNNDSNAPSVFATTPTGSTSAKAADGSIQSVAETVLPSVVKIEVAGSSESGSGSGIILTADGTILTNAHVVDVAGKNGKIRVDFNDGTSASATILGTDTLTDTAVIKADKTGLKPATIGSSGDLAVGQTVVAIGSPYGLDSTVTSGIVSALNRPVNVGSDAKSNATVYPAIQTDAAINPGNSGGALVNMSGQVVGINASIRTASTGALSEAGSIGLGFAIPINEVQPIIEQMIKGETPTHARLGITVHDVGTSTSTESPQDGQGDDSSPWGNLPFGQGDGEDSSPGASPSPSPRQQSVSPFSEPGAQIKDVTAGATAAKAGLKSGDIITKVNDTNIFGSDSLVATVRSYRPGDSVTLTYTRDGKEKTVTLTLDSDASSSTS